MKHSKKIHISKRDIQSITNFAIPNVFLVLAHNKILREEHLKDPEVIIQLLLKHKRAALKKMKVCWSIEAEFLNEAIRLWKFKKPCVAVVLFASAVEQLINQMYQIIFEAKDIHVEVSTEIIRSSNFDSKIGCLFSAFTGQKFPKPLGSRLRKIFSVRNAIVHFKAIPGRLDYEEDSSSKLDDALKSLKHMSLSRDFRLLEIVFEDAILKIDSNRTLASRAVKVLDDYKRRNESP